MKTTEVPESTTATGGRDARSLTSSASAANDHQLVKLQRAAGNRAVSRMIAAKAIHRHGAPEEEPLQAFHDRAIQRHGSPEEEPLQAKHDPVGASGKVLRTTGTGSTALARSVIQRVHTGIAKGKALSKYVTEIYALKPKWKGLDANGRAEALGKAANARLKDAGVEKCNINVKAFSGGTNGQLSFTTWTIDINQNLVSKDEVTDAELSDVADTMYHEARHAEQWFRIARWLAGTKKKTAAEISADMGIPEAVAKKACASGLKESSKTGRKFMGKAAIAEEAKMLSEAEAWHKNIYGTGRTERNATLRNLTPTGDAYVLAKKDYDDNYTNAVKANQDAEKKYLDANDAFEERDAEWDKALEAYHEAVAAGGGGLSELMAAKVQEFQVIVLEALKDQAFEEWKAAYEKLETLEKNLDTATKEAIKAHKKYKALVEESDAWSLGDRVKKAYGEKVTKK